ERPKQQLGPVFVLRFAGRDACGGSASGRSTGTVDQLADNLLCHLQYKPRHGCAWLGRGFDPNGPVFKFTNVLHNSKTQSAPLGWIRDGAADFGRVRVARVPTVITFKNSGQIGPGNALAV